MSLTTAESHTPPVMEQLTTSQPTTRHRVDWNAVASVVSAIGLLFAAAGLFVTAQQVQLSRQIAKAEFMREFYNSIQEYNDLQLKLIEGGEWRDTASAAPQTDDEWFRLQRYMGLLEQIDVWYRDGIMEIEQIDSAYSHRIKAIATHPLIKRRLLTDEAYRWTEFLDLVSKLEACPRYRAIEYSHPAESTAK